MQETISTTSTLRETKKVRTRRAIEDAAVKVAAEHGYRGATTELIAEAAGVSPRTLFNYFPHRDDAIVGFPFHLADPDAALALADRHPSTLHWLVEVVSMSLTVHEGSATLQQMRRKLLDENPALMLRRFAAIDAFEERLTEVTIALLTRESSRRRLAASLTTEEEARLHVTIVGSALRHLVRSQVESNPATPHQFIKDTHTLIAMMALINGEDS